MLITKFEDLEVWKASRIFVREIYSLTSDGRLSKDFPLRDQFRRAATSVMLNISEGFDSRSSKAFINFLNYSYRSASESRAVLYIALDLSYINTEIFNDLTANLLIIQKMINNLIRYLEQKSKA